VLDPDYGGGIVGRGRRRARPGPRSECRLGCRRTRRSAVRTGEFVDIPPADRDTIRANLERLWSIALRNPALNRRRGSTSRQVCWPTHSARPREPFIYRDTGLLYCTRSCRLQPRAQARRRDARVRRDRQSAVDGLCGSVADRRARRDVLRAAGAQAGGGLSAIQQRNDRGEQFVATPVDARAAGAVLRRNLR